MSAVIQSSKNNIEEGRGGLGRDGVHMTKICRKKFSKN